VALLPELFSSAIGRNKTANIQRLGTSMAAFGCYGFLRDRIRGEAQSEVLSKILTSTHGQNAEGGNGLQKSP
jgi:hypothetical protein